MAQIKLNHPEALLALTSISELSRGVFEVPGGKKKVENTQK